MEAARLSCQNITGEITSPSCSDLNHWAIVRPKNSTWDKNPREYIRISFIIKIKRDANIAITPLFSIYSPAMKL